MRPYGDAAKCWPELTKFISLSDLKNAVKDSQSDHASIQGLRSVFWKIFLLFQTLDRTTWPKRLQDSRAAYTSLRAHFLRSIEHPDELESAIDPLTESEESPWAALRQDEALRAEILQDVDRCMPENLYFRQPTTQNMLLDILFIFSKLNPDVSYRQGMHELLAPVLWVIERDAIAQDAPRRGQDHEIFTLFDSRYIEHDTFTLFGLMMQSAKTFYETGSSQGKSSANTEAPMVLLCKRVFEDYLPRVDPDLASHLHEISILPQVFLMHLTQYRRWVRLLFGREFPFDDMLQMWDIIFAEDPTLEIVDLVCIVMLLRIRWQLTEADYSTALTLLLRYPEPSDAQGARTFVSDAIFLKSHFHSDGGSHIVHKHTGRHLPLVSQAGTVSASPDIPVFTVSKRSRSPPKTAKRSSQPVGQVGLEGLLQDAARGVFKRGEKWGVNQAVRDAVGEVRKNVQGLQAARGSPRGKSSESTEASKNPEKLLRKISRLEERNRTLAKMLEGAVAELWNHQKSVTETKESEGDSVNALSMAIARVQFVQVYLEDSSMKLPEDDTQIAKPPSDKEPPNQTDVAQQNSAESKLDRDLDDDSSALEKPPTPAAKSSDPERPDPDPPQTHHRQKSKPTPVTTSSHSPPPPPSANTHPATAPSTQPSFPPSQSQFSASSSPPPAPTNLNASRPSLAQSSFSWMLGSASDDSGARRASSFISASPFPAERRRMHAAGNSRTDFLFGDEGSGSDGFEGVGTSGGKGGGKGKGKPGGGKAEEGRSEVFDLGEMGSAG
ncbi:RabGAP/TBC [Viridothelium virens]|uniref:RabGAP/TBC n=1 Tax=Viridothelium virens TaxID=1048519 RepID=A0A6A6HGE3_VIRVR|nr:RabGAP/TBC [Viridothelium virens]